MLEAIILLQARADVFEQRAAVRNVFELLDSLPGDVQAPIPCDHIPDQHVALIPSSERGCLEECIVRDDQIECEAACVGRQKTIVKGREVCGIWLLIGSERLDVSRSTEQDTANMREAVLLSRIQPAFELGLVHIKPWN